MKTPEKLPKNSRKTPGKLPEKTPEKNWEIPKKNSGEFKKSRIFRDFLARIQYSLIEIRSLNKQLLFRGK
jgi:hypothetical protein